MTKKMFVEKLKNLNRSKKLFPFGIQTVRVLQNSIKDVRNIKTLSEKNITVTIKWSTVTSIISWLFLKV